MKTWVIQSAWVKAEIQSLGGMVGPAWFNLGDRLVQPLAVAPWSDENNPEHAALPGILRRLRGEWPCVPFGLTTLRPELPGEWRSESAAGSSHDEPHGPSSNMDWRLVVLTEDCIELILEYPPSHPVERLRRVVRASSCEPRLEMTLIVHARIPCEFPIALHPILSLPERPRRALLDMGSDALAWTSPVPLEPDIATFRADVRGVPLTEIPRYHGREDITRLPLPYAAEESVLVTGHAGRARLHNLEEHYTAMLEWDHTVFPACHLWLSNRGRQYYPWNGRFLALGIEPARSAFDLGTGVSRNRSNPLWRTGIECTQTLSPEHPFETTYSITLEESARCPAPAKTLRGGYFSSKKRSQR